MQETGVLHSICGILMGVEVEVWRPDFTLYCLRTHIVVVLLEVDQLLLQGLDFALQVEAAQVGVVDDLPQTHDVGLHRLPDGQLRLVPDRGRGGEGTAGQGRAERRAVRTRVVQLLKFTHGDCFNTENSS